MKLIILTQYFPPETGAPQNRLYELAVRMMQQGIDITILTAMPNYPTMKIHPEYAGKWLVKEKLNGLNLIRSWIFARPGKGVINRLLNYFSFVFSSLLAGTTHLPKADFLMVESPPLFLGITAYLLSRLKKAKLIFNVSDLWPESAEKLEIVTNRYLIGPAYSLEKFLYHRASLVTGQTQGIVNNIAQRFPSVGVYWLRNGVDTTLFDPALSADNWRQINGFDDEDVVFLYAGIFGHAQDLATVIRAAAMTANHRHLKFVFVGTGPEEKELKKLAEELAPRNVFFFPNQPKASMPALVKGCDVAVIHLRPLDLFLGAIPSKIFENLAMEKPLLLGVDGEARQLFATEGGCALYCQPGNPADMAEKAITLARDAVLRKQLGSNGRKYVQAMFNRDIIARDFIEQLEALKKSTHTK